MQKILGMLLAAVFLLGTGVFAAQQEEQQAYGWQMMTEQERQEDKQQMRELKSGEERETYRYQHHKKMQGRARQQRVTLPETPGSYGKGMGPGGKRIKGGKQ